MQKPLSEEGILLHSWLLGGKGEWLVHAYDASELAACGLKPYPNLHTREPNGLSSKQNSSSSSMLMESVQMLHGKDGAFKSPTAQGVGPYKNKIKIGG